jgi:hypothetical protein
MNRDQWGKLVEAYYAARDRMSQELRDAESRIHNGLYDGVCRRDLDVTMRDATMFLGVGPDDIDADGDFEIEGSLGEVIVEVSGDADGTVHEVALRPIGLDGATVARWKPDADKHFPGDAMVDQIERWLVEAQAQAERGRRDAFAHVATPAATTRANLPGLDQAAQPSIRLLTTLGNMAVHIEEYFEQGGSRLDRKEVEMALADPDVKAWVQAMGPLLPKKRRDRLK